MSKSHSVDILKSPRRYPVNFMWLAVLVVLGLSGWQFYRYEQRLNALRHDTSRSVNELAKMQRHVKQLSDELLTQTHTINAQLRILENRISQSSNQYAVLNDMYQQLTRTRADWLLPETEYTLTIANQQLQLAGNVTAAITALDYLTKRLASTDQPQLIRIRKSVSHDLEVLNALPKLDLVALTVKLDSLIESIDRLPLSVDMNRTEAYAFVPHSPANTSVWERIRSELLQSLGKLIHIRRMDKPEAVLLSPQQRLLLMENLKLRLLDARLAIMQRDGGRFNTDIAAVRDYVVRYCDGQAQLTRQWLTSLGKLNHIPINLNLPDLSASLKLVRDAQGTGL